SVNPVSITIDGSKTITAKFIQGYTFAVDTIGSGTVTKYPDQATYLPGQQVSLTAFPGTNWDFSAWSGACTGNGTCVVTMDRSKFITATFTQTQYTLDFYVLPVGGTTSTVNKDPDQATYSYGQQVTLTPNPQLGWYFTSWGRDLTGSVNPSVITIDGNKTVYATFSTSYAFPAATISPTGAGTVTKSPNATSYNYGTVVNLTAAPSAGWVFDHWGDSCSGTVNPCVVTVDGAESVTAYFINSAYTNVLTIDKTIGGTVTPNPTGGSYADGTIVTLTAAPATGYTFGQWNGDCSGEPATTCTLTMNGSKSVSATFTPNTYTLTIINNPATGSGTTTPAAGVITYPYGTVVNVFPNPAAGYKFGSWTGNCSGTGACQLTMTANRTVTANFLAINHNLTIAVDPSVGGTTSPAIGTYPYLEGSIVEVTAIPAEGYEFAEWSGACSGIGSCSVTMDMPKTVTAIFAKDLEYLNLDITGNGAVIQDPPPPYHHGDEVTLTADPDHNWEFSEWGGACVGQGNPCTLTMDADKAVSAPFVENLCYIPQNLIGDTGTLREDFETLTGWTVNGSQPGYSATLNTTDFKVGNSSIKLTPPTTYGYVSMIKTVNWDMSAPDERGNFRFWVYVHGTDEPVDFTITMSNNPQYSNTFVTYYNASYKFQYRPGWNLVNLKASDWNVGVGSPSWNNPIVSIRIAAYGTSVTSYSIDGLESGTNGIPAVILTFDDGHNTLWNQAYAYMEPRNVRGTGYIITNQVDTIDRVTWAQLQEIYDTGWTVGNHTAAHTTLTTLSLSGQEAALLAARNALNSHGLTNVDYVAYPYGNYNADTLTAMANLGMRTSRTLLNFYNVSPLTNPYELAQKSIGLTTT
ncbi:MAG: InlB B-repeat-containing protein, partial [Desulfuromonadaceae bacterium]